MFLGEVVNTGPSPVQRHCTVLDSSRTWPSADHDHMLKSSYAIKVQLLGNAARLVCKYVKPWVTP